VKPSDEFATIVAGVVSANTFQLLNSSGGVIAELGTSVAIGSDYNALRLIHLDTTPGMVDSELAWSRVPPASNGSPVTVLVGPKVITTGTAPFVQLQQTLGTGVSRGVFNGGSAGAGAAQVSASADSGGSTLDLSANEVNLAPAIPGGRVQINGRDTMQCLSIQTSTCTANTAYPTNPAFAFFTGILVAVTMSVGDMFEAHLSVDCNAAVAAAAIGSAQITILDPNGVFQNPPNTASLACNPAQGIRANVSQFYTFTATVAGIHQIQAGGTAFGAAPGVFTAILTHTRVLVRHYGLR